MKMLKKLFLGLCVCTLFACNSNNDDDIQSTNYLSGTTWGYESQDAGSAGQGGRHWASLQFVSDTQVSVAWGYEAASTDINTQDGHSRRQEHKHAVVGQYTYHKPLLKITLPAKGDTPVRHLTFNVDETGRTITATASNDVPALEVQAVYRKQ